MAALSSAAAARFLGMDFALREMHCNFSVGLNAATRAIWHAKQEIAQPNVLSQVIKEYTGGSIEVDNMSTAQSNAALASLVREVAAEHGWLAGWKCLARACPDCGMHPTLMEDISLGVEVYKRVRVAGDARPRIDVKFSVVSAPRHGSIHEIGPKSIGGHNWETDEAYKKAVVSWMSPGDLRMGPCLLFAWIGAAKKVDTFEDATIAGDFWTAQLLGIVDYDFDKDETNMRGGITHAIERTAKIATEYEGNMRGSAWIGLVTMDQQYFNRSLQMEWVRQKQGSFVYGPSDIPPYDFAVAGYIDCAALAPFAYQTAAELESSRTAMFVGVLFANMHDLLFDIGCSSRISAAAYAYSTGTFQYDLPQAFAVGMIDAIAARTLKGPPDQKPVYGENALYATCAWDIFNVRYRAWERFVKYTRLLRGSRSAVAAGILQRAKKGMVLVPEDLNAGLGQAWQTALNLRNVSKLTGRQDHTKMYTITKPAEVLELHGVNAPQLCGNCSAPFQEAFLQEKDEVQGIPGLPPTVTTCAPVAIAAAIRRASVWATTSDCCDGCACTVGIWANETSDRVIVALMQCEREASSRDWLLQNYFIGCVAFSPLRLISVLTGFDLVADIRYERGAMGERDNFDCWE